MDLTGNKYNLDIKQGLINCIIGGNGSGKSKILDDIRRINKYRIDIGIVSQFPEDQVFCTDVKSHLSYSLKPFNYSVDQLNKKIIDSLKLVELNIDYLNKLIKELSSSELYKIVLASALIINPKILILDGSFVSMDINSEKNLIKIIRTIKRRYNKTIVIFSDNSDFVHTIADYVFVVNDNKIVLEGNKYSVFENEEVLNNCHITLPKVILFEKLVLKKKNINMGYRDNINDLLKDIYYYK